MNPILIYTYLHSEQECLSPVLHMYNVSIRLYHNPQTLHAITATQSTGHYIAYRDPRVQLEGTTDTGMITDH